MIYYADILNEVLSLFPKEIKCDDIHLVGSDGLSWKSLDDIYNKIDKENNYFKDTKDKKTNELLGALLWSVLVGITEGLKNNYIKKNKPCIKVSLLIVINLKETKKHFLETIKDEIWKDYLDKLEEDVIFSCSTIVLWNITNINL